jgi:hypothetical protein
MKSEEVIDMTNEFQEIYYIVMHSVRCEDVFGKIPGDKAEVQSKNLESLFQAIFREIDPDSHLDNLDEKEMATEAANRLKDFYNQAVFKIKNGTYGTIQETVVKGRITSPAGKSYQLTERLGSASRYSMYQCLLPDEKFGLLKVTTQAQYNSNLDREALILRILAERAIEVEKQNKTSLPYNYQLFFPRLVESFISKEQDNRRINILAFPDQIKKMSQLTPISSIIKVERERVDPKTGAWMLGKELKALAFAHDQNISNESVFASNILVEKELHGVIVFDWSSAILHSKKVPGINRMKDIIQAARLAIAVMGGDLEEGTLPESEQLPDGQFEKYIFKLAKGQVNDSNLACRQFYDLIREMWPERDFHPYTSYPRD